MAGTDETVNAVSGETGTKNKRPVVHGSAYKLGDYTIHIELKQLKNIDEDRLPYEGNLVIRDSRFMHRVEGRGLVCKCARGDKLSVTVRGELSIDTKDPHFRNDPPVPDEYEDVHGLIAEEYDRAVIESTSPEWHNTKYPVTVSKICDTLGGLIFANPTAPKKGVVVIAGATNSVKSEVARGLIIDYLRRLVRPKCGSAPKNIERRPHLVTFEDPIESLFYGVDMAGNTGERKRLELSEAIETARKIGIDYTPCESGADGKNLETALLRNALRQTPAIFYVGEIRDIRDWRHVMEFAGTGHLLITTTHAGSLVEAMERIFQSVNANTPDARGRIAQRILAIIHQRKITIEQPADPKSKDGQKEKVSVVIPSLWRQTDRGVAALVSDGLASVLPHNPAERQADGSLRNISSLGRRWFAKKLLKHAPENVDRELFDFEATKLDLQGI